MIGIYRLLAGQKTSWQPHLIRLQPRVTLTRVARVVSSLPEASPASPSAPLDDDSEHRRLSILLFRYIFAAKAAQLRHHLHLQQHHSSERGSRRAQQRFDGRCVIPLGALDPPPNDDTLALCLEILQKANYNNYYYEFEGKPGSLRVTTLNIFW